VTITLFPKQLADLDLLVILGPTVSGKTRLAVNTARQVNGEIISADSRQVYRGMDIGTGKDLDEYHKDGKAVPYHLIDIVEPGYEFNVFEFQQRFLDIYPQIKERGKLPILCGGTGLYLESVLCGYRMLPTPENEELRAELEGCDDKTLIARLASLKMPHNTTDLTNRKRLIRAIEIAEYAAARGENIVDFPVINAKIYGIHWERKVLRERITIRLKTRFAQGMVEEVKALLKQGLTPQQLKFYGLEYRYITEYLTAELTYDEMFRKLNTAIHRFAKRQMTWFRRMEKRGIDIEWLEVEEFYRKFS